MPCKIVGGTKCRGNESSSEQKVQGTKVPMNFCSPGTKVPRERKGQGTTFIARERKFPGTKGLVVLGNERSWARKVAVSWAQVSGVLSFPALTSAGLYFR